MKLRPKLKDVTYVNNGMRGETDTRTTALLEDLKRGDH